MVTATVTAAAVAVTVPRTVASVDVGIALNVTNGIELTGCANMRQRNKAVYKSEAFHCFWWDKDGGEGGSEEEGDVWASYSVSTLHLPRSLRWQSRQEFLLSRIKC
jgi:hypothetical protein